MQTTNFGGIPLSQLMLGTVQFGLPYGIANTKGQPSYEDVLAILSAAYEGGVNCLDTAARYGESETVLGRALSDLKLTDSMTVVTKVTHLADGLGAAEADKIIEQSILESLSRLNLEVLPIVLFHRQENYEYVDSLLKLKERGLVRYVGSSVNHTAPTRAILESERRDEAFQIPANLLDHRFRREGLLQKAKEQGAGMFVRSVYLQGLLLMPETQVPEELATVIPIRRQLEKLAAEAGIGVAELSVRYILGLEGVTCCVVGVDSVEQMKANVELFAKNGLDESLSQAIEELVPPLAEEILLPFHWSNRMPDIKPEGR